jgi:hypothetical protein
VPTGAEAAAVSVNLLVEAVLPGLNATVTPVGNPLAARVGEPVNPFRGVTVRVLLPEVPCVTLRLAGAAANAKPGAAVIVKPTVTVVENVPAVPVTVTVDVPIAALGAAVNVTMPLPAVAAGPNAAVTPLGRPDAVYDTLLLKPFFGTTVSVSVPLVPCIMFMVGAEAVSEKVGGRATVNATPTVAVRFPDFPVTVTLLVAGDALALAAKLRVLADAVLAGVNDAVTPLGSPVTVRLTALANPFTGTTVIESVPVAPGATLTAAVDAFRL